jgi:UDP-N-acetyl-D-glucosamine dehydrogenase
VKEYASLANKIKSKKARIGIIGLGYVGLPLALLLTKKGFRTLGFVRNKDKYRDLFSAKVIGHNSLSDCDIYIICVPTPVKDHKQPDLTALKSVAARLKKINLTGKLIINESTVAPFTTRKVLGSLGKNYFLASSPERISPGDKKYTVENIPKVIGGQDKRSTYLAARLYRAILSDGIVPVSSLETAEMTKILENTYRAVNIALINEFALLAEKINVDILEVIGAAKSKWTFQAHYPGIGVGGHCIPVDPYYLLELAEQKKVKMPVVRDSLEQNEEMPHNLAQKIISHYKQGMKVLIYGLTYKKDVADMRESPVMELIKVLKNKKISFTVYDPLVKKQKTALEKPVDIFVVGTDHNQLAKDYKKVVTDKTIVIDGKNYFKKNVGKKVIGVGRKLE